jgi:DNA-binding NtrC family response regulator
LIESALFGHERGAFTGALKRSEGAFERAHNGTLLLDEVSEMRIDLQAKLLRVLQEREFERVGGSATIRVDVRVIATTNRDLAAEVAAGTFREDLYYRLNVIPIAVPSLRERREDIPLLAQRFAQRTALDAKRELLGFAPETLELLKSLPWPGNVRELQHAVERAVVLSGDKLLQPHSFERARFGLVPAPSASVAGTGPTLVLNSYRMAEAEEQLIQRALESVNGNRTRAAALLGIGLRTLRAKLNAPDEAAESERAGDEELIASER